MEHITTAEGKVVDLFDKLANKKGPLDQYAHWAHGYFAFPQLEGEIGPRMYFRGKEKIVWNINNYLGLANHPEVRKADAEAAALWGLAYPMGARIMSGETKFHLQLEEQLAEFVGKEAALLMNYGFQGMLSLVPALLDRRDVVVYDAESHACIVDGTHLHTGKRFVYPHNDIDALKNILEKAERIAKRQGGGILVVTDGVFGMSGVQGAIKEIVELKNKFRFRLLVDDAHGFGVMGANGRGIHEEQAVMEGVDLYFATFAKAMASIGAFVAGPAKIINFLRYNVRSQVFAKSLPLPIVIGNLKRLELVRTRPALRQRLWHITRKLQQGLREAGFDIGKTTTPITPVFFHCSMEEAAAMAIDLRENYDIFVSGVVYPIVPRGRLQLRIIPTAVHSEEDVEITIRAFKEVKQKLDSGEYKNTPAIPLIAQSRQ